MSKAEDDDVCLKFLNMLDSEYVLQQIFMGKLPEMEQASLTAMGDKLPMNKLCSTVDKLIEVVK